MNKIAAYEIALQRVEQEKRAEFIIENFGTCDGQMPEAYLHAFDSRLEKVAVLGAVGSGLKAVGSGIGKAIGHVGSAVGKGAQPLSTRARLGQVLSSTGYAVTRSPYTQGLVGAGALGTAGAGAAGLGAGFMGGRMTAPSNQ